MSKLRGESRISRNVIIGIIFVFVALIGHEIFGKHGVVALRRERHQYQTLQQQIQRLQIENEHLQQRVNALKSDPRAIEKLAREQLRLARPGEIIFTLPDKQQPPNSPTSHVRKK